MGKTKNSSLINDSPPTFILVLEQKFSINKVDKTAWLSLNTSWKSFLKSRIPNFQQILTASKIRGQFRVFVPIQEPFPVFLKTSSFDQSSWFTILRVNILPPKVSVSLVPNKPSWRHPEWLALRIHIVSQDHSIRVIVVGAHHHDIALSHSRSISDNSR